MRASLAESDELLAGSATIMEIREHARQWRASGGPEARQRKTLARWGAACEENITALKKHEAVWRATLAGTQSLAELASVRDRVRQIAVRNRDRQSNCGGKASDNRRTAGPCIEAGVRYCGYDRETRQRDAELPETTLPCGRAADLEPAARERDDESAGAIFRTALGRSYSNSSEFVQSQKGLVFGNRPCPRARNRDQPSGWAVP